MSTPDKLISSILKHDNKQNSYKIGLIRAINDVVLTYPDMLVHGQDIAIPIHLLARHWIAYYWAFVDPEHPIYQGTRAYRRGKLTNDMAFRPYLLELRQEWEHFNQTSSPSDGYFLINHILLPRKYKNYTQEAPNLIRVYNKTLGSVMKAIEQPMRYAGTALEGEFSVFKPLPRYANAKNIAAIPGTEANDRCIVVPAKIWETFRQLSLWIEALCIQEWSLFVPTIDQKDRPQVRSGEVFDLLTQRPDNRVPLTWERHRIFTLLQEGITFTCTWSHRPIRRGDEYALDHLIPVSVYPMNEMWNLVPTHPHANLKKSNRIPSPLLLERAIQPLIQTYDNYSQDQQLELILKEDSLVRFSTLKHISEPFNESLAGKVINFMTYIAESRNLPRVENF